MDHTQDEKKHAHATGGGINTRLAATALPCKLPEIFCHAGSTAAAQWSAGEICGPQTVDLDLHRIWERETLSTSRVGVGSGRELVSSLVCPPFPRL